VSAREPHRPNPHPLHVAGKKTDIFCYDPKVDTWTKLVTTGSAPSERIYLGFTAAPDGKLYLFGGDNDGNEGWDGEECLN
jgi:N-acetylneuraminic acid mutarotase